MSTLEDIEKAVAQLPPDKLEAFRSWFEAFEADRLDRRIAAGVSRGAFDHIAEDALAEHRAGGSTPL